MQNKKEAFDYEALKKKTLEQFRSGKDLFSKGGAFAPLLKDFLEAALQAELDEHLEQENEEQNNRKNGYNTKVRGEPSNLRSVKQIINGVIHFDSLSIIQLGLLLLIATPISRVVFSVIGFLFEKDYLYVIISLIVLVILGYSIFSLAV